MAAGLATADCQGEGGSKMMSNAYSTAFELLTLGYSVIPSGGGDKGKAPLVNWRDFQDKAPDDGQLQDWQDQLQPHLWGIVTNDRIAVIDADTPETRAALEAYCKSRGWYIAAANSLRCSRGYVYKVLKAGGMTVKDVIANG